MTYSNAHNQGIAHISHTAGGKPFCGRRAHISVSVKDICEWPRLCVKCEAKLADMRRRAESKAHTEAIADRMAEL
jgi:hypothetical protein